MIQTNDNPFRVFRGGSWFSTDPAVVRAACRYAYAPSVRISHVGFRCALRSRAPVEVKP